MGSIGSILPSLAGSMTPEELEELRRRSQFQDPIAGFLGRSAEQMTSGARNMWEPSGTTADDPRFWEQKAQGASDVIRGSAPFLAPLAAPAVAEAPAASLLGGLLGTATSAGTEAAAKKAGAPPGMAALAGDVAGLATGFATPAATRGGEEGRTLFHSVAESLDQAGTDALARVRARGGLVGTRAAAMPVDDITDMAIWGASKLARGIADFDDWSKEMLKDLKPSEYSQLRSNLPKIYQLAQKKYDAHMARVGDQFPSTQKLLDLYQQGIDGKDWYEKTWKELQGYFGKDAERFIDFLASTSPKNTVPGNVTEALKAYMQWKNGQPFKGYLPVKAQMMEKAVRGEPFGGLKVSSFKKNLMGDPLPVTVDRWISRVFGFGEAPTDAQYKFMDYMLTQIAHEEGMEPRELQAAIWAAARENAGASTTGSSFETVLRERLLKSPDLLQTIQNLSGAGKKLKLKR